MVKYRTLLLEARIQRNPVFLLGNKHLDDDAEYIFDDSSISEIVNSIKYTRPFAISDPNGLKHHKFDWNCIQMQDFPNIFD